MTIDGKVVADFGNGSNDWQIFGGNWAVRDGVFATEPARDAKAVINGHENLRDFVLEATVATRPGGDAGLMFRVSHTSDNLDDYRGYYVGLGTRPPSEEADEPPVSPVTSGEPLQQVELIPFGSAKLRVSYFPVLKAE